MRVKNEIWYGSLRTEKERIIKDVYAWYSLAFLRLLYVDWDDLEEVLLLLGLGVVLVRGVDLVGLDVGDRQRCFKPENVWFPALKMRISCRSEGKKK